MRSGRRGFRPARRPVPGRRVAATALAVLLAAGPAASGCSSGDAEAGTVSPPRRGGTLYLQTDAAGFTHLDPQRAYTSEALNVGRLITRTLTTFKTVPGHPAQLAPDLATDLGRPSNENRTWEFTLKPGVRWEDGRPVSCTDLKYGVERRFSDLITGGPSYPRDYLADTSGYTGPYVGDNDGGHGLTSVTCLDSRTIRYQLSRPIGDFGDTVSMPVFAPVRQDKDTKDKYDQRVFSDGPYRIDSSDASAVTLTRDRYWDAGSDPVRAAYPDRIVVRFGLDPARSTNDLITDAGTNRDSVQLDFNVPPNFVQQVVNDADLSARTVTGPTGALRYLAINTHSVTDVRCRQALAYATDRESYRMAVGGSIFGDYATTMLTPGMPARAQFDRYGGLAHPEGDVPAATKLVTAAGDCPAKLTLDYPDVPAYGLAVQSLVDSYQRIGVQVVPNPIAKTQFYNVVGVPTSEHDLVLAAWVPDWPNGSALIPALFEGKLFEANESGGNYNFSELDDSDVDGMIEAAKAQADLDKQYAAWASIDRTVAGKAVAVPMLYERGLELYGGGVRGVEMQPQFGEPDVLTMGLAGTG